MMRPGLIFHQPTEDTAFGPLSRIDHALLNTGTLVGMHEHRNDEIFSYMWRGTMVHEDTSGDKTPISPERLMMMNAGSSFFHEESVPSGQEIETPKVPGMTAWVYVMDGSVIANKWI